jgi:hypothetical protein
MPSKRLPSEAAVLQISVEANEGRMLEECRRKIHPAGKSEGPGWLGERRLNGNQAGTSERLPFKWSTPRRGTDGIAL